MVVDSVARDSLYVDDSLQPVDRRTMAISPLQSSTFSLSITTINAFCHAHFMCLMSNLIIIREQDKCRMVTSLDFATLVKLLPTCQGLLSIVNTCMLIFVKQTNNQQLVI